MFERDVRVRYMISKVAELLAFESADDPTLLRCFEENVPAVKAFLSASGSPKLTLYYQPRLGTTRGGKNEASFATLPVPADGQTSTSRTNLSKESMKRMASARSLGQQSTMSLMSLMDIADLPSSLYIADAESEQLFGQCVYFVRKFVDKEISNKDGDLAQEIISGKIDGSPLNGLEHMLHDVYLPLLQSKNDWGKNTDDSRSDYVVGVSKFVDTLNDAVQVQAEGVELILPNKQNLVSNNQQAFVKAAGDDEIVGHYEDIMDAWCQQSEKILNETNGDRHESEDVGPNTELEFWKQRMGKLNSITEQLKSKECKVVLGVLAVARSRMLKRWRSIDNAITDAVNEAKDNVKYLTTLEKYLEPLYKGTPLSIIDMLPGLLNNIKMMHSIARYYNTTERMTTLFVKITNQMITNCKKYLLDGSSREALGPGMSKSSGLWTQPTAALLKKMAACVKLNEAYQDQYRQTRDKLLTQPKSKQFDFNELQIFGKFNLLCKRVQKLMDIFTTVDQFTTLAESKIDGMENLTQRFFDIVEDLKKKKYDLLDFSKTQFDKDYVEFVRNIQELETALQVFINSSFENITSTENALALLRKFQAILQRENLKQDLDSKYMVIFHNYGLDLENVQKTYERFKHNPPMVRNAPPVAGNIMWARQLLRRIEVPMKNFQANRNIMTTKESKKIIRTYNKVARALVEFETLWHYAWTKSIEAAKAGLQATLIIRHPDNNRLYVNFDQQILQLIKEAKWLLRMGVEVPESAKLVLMQEDKFKSYYNQLNYALKEYERVVGRIIPVTRGILEPHVHDLERKIQPGMVILTWTSMNIDGYLHSVHHGITRLEELVSKVNDVVDTRIGRSIKSVARMNLVEVPDGQTFTLDQFVAMQDKVARQRSQLVNTRTIEAERAVYDCIETVRSYPLESQGLSISNEAAIGFYEYYHRMMFQAILKAVISSLKVIKDRVGTRTVGVSYMFVDFPLFEVDVELTIPNVTMNPSIDEIQEAINRSCVSILRAIRTVDPWKNELNSPGSSDSFYDRVTKNVEIVKVVLLLTGSVHGLKHKVMEQLREFKKYDYLWRDDKAMAYEKFIAGKPNLEAFEAELKQYLQIEHDISNIVSCINIGMLSLMTQPMKYSLKAEAAAWKSLYAKNLHQTAKNSLDGAITFMEETSKKLKREINDLEDLRFVMMTLKELRQKESEIDLEFNPVEEMYALLIRYDVRVPKEEVDAVGDIRYRWKKLMTIASQVNEKVAQMQGGFKRDLVRSVKSFVVDVIQFRNDFDANGPMIPGLAPMEAMDRLTKFQRLYEERDNKYITYSAGEDLFGLPKQDYPELAKTKKELQLLDKLYSLYMNVIKTVNGYADLPWMDLDFQKITDEVNAFANQCKKLPKALRTWEAYTELKKTIDDFLELQPLLEQLSNKAMRTRHWSQIMQISGHTFKLEADEFKLQDLLDAQLLDHKEDVEDVCIAAVKEQEIENKISGIADDWSDQQLSFAEYKSRGPLLLKGSDISEIMEKLEDSQMTLGSIVSSRYVAPFREEVQGWLMKLSGVFEVIEQWMSVQSMWMYLEAVFASGDIAKQLPQEAKRFNQIDKSWCKIMLKAFDNRNVIGFCYQNELLKSLPFLAEQLELCQKSLSGYLEQKRNCFPRFYFVSDPVLLEILSQASDPHAIQPHLSSIFDSIDRVTFDRSEKNKITWMHSGEGEDVQMEEPVIAAGNVEEWLLDLEYGMQNTMHAVVHAVANECLEVNLEDLCDRFCAQTTILAIQFRWTAQCQDALIRAKADKKIMSETQKLTNQVLTDLTKMTTQELTPLQRTKIETLITIQVHQKDVWDSLVKQKIRDPTDFEWQKQARFYWNEDKDKCLVSIADIDFEYDNEYLGCKERLVITPLTDRCYISLSQALGMYLGGAPAGPAGTGKTETTKDLGRALGKYVVVFNCSDQMDYRAMGKIFKGLAQCGAWGCFDEFNRIELEVLSVVAQQVQCVLSAIREHKKEFTFTDGQLLTLIPKCGFFITMNPGYAGRQELPENLKALFRGVAMMVPDRRIIIKVKLAAAGYLENESLSLKFHVLYRLCEQQLSKQPHYDFGLRNILSVLRTAGATKRREPSKSEVYLLMRTLRDMNMSKYVADDVPLFISLLNDLFPKIKAEKASNESVEAAIKTQVDAMGLIHHDAWVDKVIQLYDTSLVRHGIMVVGPSGAGKSMCYEVLLRALSAVDTMHKSYRMNPKAITAPQMFGKLDVISNDWTDGIFAALWRKANKDKNNIWIICDGPVDAVWIENLNTVLDDNKLLTLANGDRIKMAPSVKMCFEPENLNNASPATVSRAGIIFISDTVLGWEPVMDAKFKKVQSMDQSGSSTVQVKSQDAQLLFGLFKEHMDESLTFVVKQLQPVMHVCNVNLAATCFDLIMGQLAVVENPADNVNDLLLNQLFIYALTWSVGGILEPGDRQRFSTFLAGRLSTGLPDPVSADPNSTSLYDYFVDCSTCEWVAWEDRVESWSYPGDEEFDFSALYVPTIDSTRSEYFLSLLGKQSKSVLLVGGSGTAKTTTSEQYLFLQNPDLMLYKKISFSSATRPEIFQRTIEAAVEKRMGTTYGPPGGRKMIVFIDDISMPEINEWNDQPTNEIVRQLVEEGGFYNLDKPGEWKSIVDTQYIGAMAHPGGGKNDIPNRLKRHFAILNMVTPDDKSLDQIFGSLMRGRFTSDRFDSEIVDIASRLTEVSVQLWKHIAKTLLPTPDKFHYVFTLRDIAKIFQGVMFCPSESIVSGASLLQLWLHESRRVFSDRLNNVNDKKWFDENVQNIVTQYYGNQLSEAVTEPRYFVDFMRYAEIDEDTGEEMGDAPKVYEPVETMNDLRDRVEEYQRVYNEGSRGAGMELVLFDAALKNLCRISRVIRMPRGNALLVGVGGSGKQSLTRLASYIAGYSTFQITLTKTYSVSNLLEDIKELYRKAAFERPVTFVITDNDIKDEGFLEYINMFLSSGEIAGLFPRDELDAIIGDIRSIAKKEKPNTVGKNDTYDNLYRFFIDRVRDRLHIVLCFSPVGDKFRQRARKFPALFSGCTINWFFPWPREALQAVAQKFLSTFDMADVVDEDVKARLIDFMAEVHSSMHGVAADYFQRFRRHVYSTPRSFLTFVDSYMVVYGSKLNEISTLANKIDGGLKKLLQAAEDVETMKVELLEKEKSLAEAQKETNQLLTVITESTAQAEKKKAEVMDVRNVLSADAETVAKGKAEAEADLEAAKPALEEAENALKAITMSDIQTLKKLANPPNLVKRIFDGCLLLFSNPLTSVDWIDNGKGEMVLKDSWSEALKMMSNNKFIDLLFNFPRDQINDETVELLQPYYDMQDFTFEVARKSSGNVAGLCTWVRAMGVYHEVAKVVAPKVAALKEAEGMLRVANKKLRAKEDELAKVEAELDKINKEFDEAMKRKQELEDDAQATRNRMEAANNLIGALAGEQDRWTQQSNEFKDMIGRLTADVGIICAFISYAGPFNAEFRQLLLQKRYPAICNDLGMPISQDLSPIKFLLKESQIGEWNLEGLPRDDHSVQNGIMVTRSTKWPLLIDPQGQGLQWLSKREEENQLRVCQLTDKNFRNYLEDCLSFGKPLIIENLEEELDPVLDPVLNKEFVRSGKTIQVQLGDKFVDYSDTFKLYLITKLPNPHFSPELFAKTTVIDFTVTMQGLEDQLLGRVIQQEKAELEEQRQALLQDVNMNQKKIAQLEDDLLARLSESDGNLLEDAELINVLADTKKTALEVNEKLANAKETERRISQAREEYRPVAIRGSVLYFVIVELQGLDPMYQTSLKQFLDLFDVSIHRAERAPLAKKRIEHIIGTLTFMIYEYISRGLFERHKMLFLILMACKIMLRARDISAEAFNVFLKGGAALDIDSVKKKPFAWLPDRAWLNVVMLSETVAVFRNLTDIMVGAEQQWRHLYDQEAPEECPIPDYEDRTSPFERLLLLRCLREDRTIVAASQFISDSLGQKYVDPVPFSLGSCVKESNERTPLLCLLSQGSDPTASIENLAKKMKKEVRSISMGQGQEPAAKRLLNGGFQGGSWVLLQNCHLGLKFMLEVEQMMLQTEEIDPGFRLWITTESSPRFPIGLLQMSTKITMEPPQGLKAGLKRSFQWVNQDMIEAIGRPEWWPLLYTCCFQHSIVQERRKFGPLGWNIPYEFNHGDLSASVTFLQNHLYSLGDDVKRTQVSWTAVKYMIAEVQYGGRITDDLDRRLMITYAKDWLSPSTLKADFKFYRGYTIPMEEDIEKVRKTVEELPLNDRPEVFGLHANADISYRTQQAQQTINGIMDIQPKESAGSGSMTREEQVNQIAADLISKLPKDYKVDVVKSRIKAMGGANPLNICLSQEINCLQSLITCVRRDLGDLQLAIAGTIVMSSNLQNILDSLYDARVPQSWVKLSWVAPTLGVWFSDFLTRADQLTSWLERGRPKSFWLTGFYNAQGFLTAVRQEVTRAHEGWALDDVVLKTEMSKYQTAEDVRSAPDEGIYVHGLFLEGASWDPKHQRLVDSPPKVLISNLPVMLVTACKAEDRSKTAGNRYKCPCYANPARTARFYIFDIDIPSEEVVSKWILRGVAALCTRE